MSEISSPTVWRRWLAFELTRLRKETGLDQKDVARALRCTVGKVSYYETAERPVVVRDLDEVLLPLYNVPEARWPVYLQAAKDARQKGWWGSFSADALPSWFTLFVGLEQGASQKRTYEGQAVPGLLQTKEYAAAVARRGTVESTDEENDRHVELRMTRQAVLRREPDPLRLWAVLDEAVLRRVIGSRALMADQLRHLAAMSRYPKIRVQVIPFDNGAHSGMGGPFTIFDFPWPADPGVAYIEHRAGGVYLEQPHEIEAHRMAFDHLCVLAASPEESAKMIEDAAEEYA